MRGCTTRIWPHWSPSEATHTASAQPYSMSTAVQYEHMDSELVLLLILPTLVRFHLMLIMLCDLRRQLHGHLDALDLPTSHTTPLPPWVNQSIPTGRTPCCPPASTYDAIPSLVPRRISAPLPAPPRAAPSLLFSRPMPCIFPTAGFEPLLARRLSPWPIVGSSSSSPVFTLVSRHRASWHADGKAPTHK